MDKNEKMTERFLVCMTYEPEQECHGASGRKLRQDCVYCPCYAKHKQKEKEKKNEKGA